MSVDLQLLPTISPISIATPREHAIYRDALSSNRKRQRARNVADLLERGHRSRSTRTTALLVDLRV